MLLGEAFRHVPLLRPPRPFLPRCEITKYIHRQLKYNPFRTSCSANLLPADTVFLPVETIVMRGRRELIPHI